MRNPGKFSLVAGLGGIFIMLGQLFIMGTSTVIGYLLITNINYYKENLNSAYLPTFFMAVITFTVGGLFM